MGQEPASKRVNTEYNNNSKYSNNEFSRNNTFQKKDNKNLQNQLNLNNINNEYNNFYNNLDFSNDNFESNQNPHFVANTEPNYHQNHYSKRIKCPKCNKIFSNKNYYNHYNYCKNNENNGNSRNNDLNHYSNLKFKSVNTDTKNKQNYNKFHQKNRNNIIVDNQNNNNNNNNNNIKINPKKIIYKKPKVNNFYCKKCNLKFNNRMELHFHNSQCGNSQIPVNNFPFQPILLYPMNNNFFNQNYNTFYNNYNNNSNDVFHNNYNLNYPNNNNFNDIFNNEIFNNNINNNNINVNHSENNLYSNNVENELLKKPKKKLPKGNSKGTFEEKVQYLRYILQKRKIDWMEGSDKISVNRENILDESMILFDKINPYKELKIEFKGEVSQDAGGLIREWLTVLFDILLEKLNLFERADTDEISYIITKNNIPKNSNDKYIFIGKLLAKALLENLTVNCCFNKMIYQLILNENITLNDLVFIDKPLYTSLKNLIDMKKKGEDLSILELYFSIQYKNSNDKLTTDNLIENGDNIQVTSDNLDEYIEKRIEYLINTQKKSIKLIKSGFNSIIPIKNLLIFNSDQLSLLINGTPFIDVDDWRLNTTYKNYEEYDEVIILFWDIISNLNQNELSKFLLFCTGSSRVPIGGFKTLESNRGNICKFCITKSDYNNNQKNFIRAHTCFNRLDLPNFPSRNKIEDAIKFAIENETLGFGIE